MMNSWDMPPEFWVEVERLHALSASECDNQHCAPHANYRPDRHGLFAAWKEWCDAAYRDWAQAKETTNA